MPIQICLTQISRVKNHQPPFDKRNSLLSQQYRGYTTERVAQVEPETVKNDEQGTENWRMTLHEPKQLITLHC
jgi:hypothetical protein